MRHTGILRTWHPDRGFGFVAPTQGGKEIFVHISALPRDGTQPVVGESLSFELGRHAEGKLQAMRVQRLALGAALASPGSGAAPRVPPAPARDTSPTALSHRSEASHRAAHPAAGVRHAPMGHAGRTGARASTSSGRSSAGSALGWWRRGGLAVAVVALAGFGHSQVRQRQRPLSAPTPSEAVAESWGGAAMPTSPRVLDASPAAPGTFRCDGRTHCSQMTSCAEAQYFLAHCPGVKMDGDGDGRPCEEQLCGH
jgi:cold shock CspA family protein